MTEEGSPGGQHRKSRKLSVKKIILLVVGGFFALMIMGSCMGSSDNDSGSSNQDEASSDQEGSGSEEESNTVGLNEAGTTGSLEVTVTSVESTSSYGSDYSEETPTGVYQVVALEVKNTGNESSMFDDSSVKLVDESGAQHSTASETMTSNQDMFLENINPGNSISGEAVFDVPEDATVDEIEVTPSGFDFSEPLTVQVN